MGTLCTSGCRTVLYWHTRGSAESDLQVSGVHSFRGTTCPGVPGRPPLVCRAEYRDADSTVQNVRWATYFCRSVHAGEMHMYGMMYEWPASPRLSLSIGPELLNNLY